MTLSASGVPAWLKKAVGSARSEDDHLKALLLVGREFGISPIELFGGEVKIRGMIGDAPVDLTVEYPGTSSVLFNDMLKFLSEEAKAKQKASKKKR